ncbi:MAG: hypothetical protein DME25_13370, partial [Verrucomicrobia bacterium]
CRWATDYRVPATGARLAGDQAPANFVSAVLQRAAGKLVVPVWVTECEEEDLPANKRADGKTTGLCGTVGCALGLCPKEFTRQWSALLSAHAGPIGLLALPGEFDRQPVEPSEGSGWLKNTLGYLDQVPPKNNGKTLPHDRLWLVVQGYDTRYEAAAKRLAAEQGMGAVVVARTRIDQSFEPRIIKVEE